MSATKQTRWVGRTAAIALAVSLLVPAISISAPSFADAAEAVNPPPLCVADEFMALDVRYSNTSDSDIWLMNMDGTCKTNLTGPNYSTDELGVRFVGDGTWIAYMKTVYDKGPCGCQVGLDIFAMDLAEPDVEYRCTSSGPGEVTTSKDPSWSPDGTKIAYVSNDTPDQPNNYDIWVIDLHRGDGGGASASNPVKVIENPNPEIPWRAAQPTWSPDSSQIAFTLAIGDGSEDIYKTAVTIGSPNSQPQRLTFDDMARDRSPDWSPRGDEIAFSSNRIVPGNSDGSSEIFTMSPQGDSTWLRQVTSTGNAGSAPQSPRWGFDGSVIFYSYSNWAAFTFVAVVNRDGTGRKFVGKLDSLGRPDQPGTRNGHVDVSAAGADLRARILAKLGAAANAPYRGDPVNVASGNAHFAEADLSVSAAGPPLSLVRHYNNRETETTTLGPGWRSSFDWSVERSTGPFGNPPTAVVTRDDGRRDTYLTSTATSQQFVAAEGRHDDLDLKGDHFELTDTANLRRIFDPSGRLSSVRDARGIGYDLVRDETGRLLTVEHTKGSSIVLDYDASGHLAEASSPTTNRTVKYRYADGLLSEVERDGGEIWRYTYTDGRLSTMTDPGGRVIFTQSYDDLGRVAEQADGRANSTSFEYESGDALGAGTATTKSPADDRAYDSFDTNGFVTSSTDEIGATSTFGYNAAGDRTDFVDATGAPWRMKYNRGGDPIETTDPNGSVTRSTYRSDHQPSSTLDPTGLATVFDYDDFGSLASVNSAGHTTLLFPNPDGTISATISPDGLVTKTEYDTFGRPVAQIDPAGRRTTTVYNADGTVSATISPDGATSTTYYDAARRPRAVRDPLGATTAFGYDASGNQSSVTDPRGQPTNFGYDAAYNLYETSATIEGGEVIRAGFSYDRANRLDAVTAPGGSGTSTYSYTPTGNLKSITDADGASFSYEYSLRGEMTRSVAPDGIATEFFYDPAGRLVSTVNQREGETTFSYDAAGRPLGTSNSAGHSQIFQYDGAGRQVGSAETTNLLNVGGEPRPFGVTQTLSPGGRRVGHAQGRFAYSDGVLVARDTAETAYFYNDDGSLERTESEELIGPGAITNSYDDATGRLAEQASPATTAAYGYDGAGRISEMTTTIGAGVTVGHQTRYDASGNVTEMGGSTYTYDALGRLVAAHDGELGDDYQYQYDLASNRTQVRKNGEITQQLSYTTADEIDTAAHPEFAYDAAGRLISDTTAVGEKRTYHWDGYGRLAGIDLYLPATGHSENLRLSYDASGRLAEKRKYFDLTWPVERLFFHYDGDRLIAEEDMTGTVREYLYAGGEAPTAMRARQADGTYQNYFFVTNTHGDVVALTDRDGNIVNRYAYGPWGEATRVSETVHQPFRYAGYRYDDGFDLYYLRARWMDPGTGRFLSRDSVRGSPKNLRSHNRYVHAECSPATRIDPTGHGPRALCESKLTPTTDSLIALRVALDYRGLVRALTGQVMGARVPPELVGAIIWVEQLPRGIGGEVGDIIDQIFGGPRDHSYGITNVKRSTLRHHAWLLPPGHTSLDDLRDPTNAIIATQAVLQGIRYELDDFGYLWLPWEKTSSADLALIASRYNWGNAPGPTGYGRRVCEVASFLRDEIGY